MPPIDPELAARRLAHFQQLWRAWRLQSLARSGVAEDRHFAQQLGISVQQLSRLKAGAVIGTQLARRFEQALGLPPGGLDQRPRLSPRAGDVELLGPEGPAALLAGLGPGAALTMPQIGHSTPAGFPSPAADVETTPVDLLDRLGLHQPTTFLARVRGLSMIGKGIDDGDLIVINRALEPKHGATVVAVIDDELTVKTFHHQGGMTKLVAANPDYPDIVPRDGQTLTIWGVVTTVIKALPA